MNEFPFIHILWNDLSQRETCPLCGNLHVDADIGLWLFVSGLTEESQRICWACAEDFSEELLNKVIIFNQNPDKIDAGLHRKMNSRFDELFEELRYLKIDLKELPADKVQGALLDEIKELINDNR